MNNGYLPCIYIGGEYPSLTIIIQCLFSFSIIKVIEHYFNFFQMNEDLVINKISIHFEEHIYNCSVHSLYLH